MTHVLTAEDIAALKEGGFDPDAHAGDDPFYTAAHELADLIRTSLTPEAAAQRLGVPLHTIERMLEERALYAFRNNADWFIPAFQFEGNRLVPGIEAVNARLADGLSPVVVSRWYTLPDDELELDGRVWTPLEWLKRQRPLDTVVRSTAHLSPCCEDGTEVRITPGKPRTLADLFPINDETPSVNSDGIEIRQGAPPQKLVDT